VAEKIALVALSFVKQKGSKTTFFMSLLMTLIELIIDFYLLKNFSFATPKRKVTKEKGVKPAKKHPVSVAGGARPCAPGFY
jgi:hypothetical protein